MVWNGAILEHFLSQVTELISQKFNIPIQSTQNGVYLATTDLSASLYAYGFSLLGKLIVLIWVATVDWSLVPTPANIRPQSEALIYPNNTDTCMLPSHRFAFMNDT